jgi:hypothetical protein
MVWDLSDRVSIAHYKIICKEYASECAFTHGSWKEEKE